VGTSQSSGGAPSGVPMVPSWVPSPAAPAPAGPQSPTPPEGQPDAAPPAAPPAVPNIPASAAPNIPLAPAGRFSSARRSLGSYASGGGGGAALRKGVGHYVRKGYGGARTAAQRMGGTASTAGNLYNALSSVASGQAAAPGSPLDPALLRGRSAQEVMDAVVESVRPDHGTLDAEAGRAAIRDALSEVLTRFPEADLLDLNEAERTFTIESFVAIDVFRRIDLDLGKTVRDKAPSATVALSRIKEIKAYVKQTVSASFRKLADGGRGISAGRVEHVVRDALLETMQVFEAYAE
jgi:hypothetical protein